MGRGSFPGGKERPGVTLTPHSLSVPWSRKSKARPLHPLWAVRPVQSLSAFTRVQFTFLIPSLNTHLCWFAVIEWQHVWHWRDACSLTIKFQAHKNAMKTVVKSRTLLGQCIFSIGKDWVHLTTPYWSFVTLSEVNTFCTSFVSILRFAYYKMDVICWM